MKVYIERKNVHVELIRFRKNIDFINIENFEVVMFATAVFYWAHCNPGRVATVLRLGAPDVSGHGHFGTRHFGSYSIRYIVTSGHAQFGT